MRKAIFAGLLVLASAGPAAAQFGINIAPGDKPKLTEEEQERNARIDRAYKAATESRPDQKASDPWGNVRAPANQAPAKAAKPARAAAKPQHKPRQ